MKSSTYFGALSIGLALALAVFGCEGETSPDTITVIEGTGLYTRTVPSIKIIKATDEYVLVGYEVPKNQDPDTAINSIGYSGFDSDSINTYTDEGSDLFSASDNKTYYAGTVTAPIYYDTDVSFTFEKQYNQSGTLDTAVVVLTVKPGNFKTKPDSYTIPDVTASNVMVYSGKPGDTNYKASLGLNERMIVVTLPTDGIAKYLKYRYKTTGSERWDNSDGGSYIEAGLNGKASKSFHLTSSSSITVELKFAAEDEGKVETLNAYTVTLEGYTSESGGGSGTEGFSITN